MTYPEFVDNELLGVAHTSATTKAAWNAGLLNIKKQVEQMLIIAHVDNAYHIPTLENILKRIEEQKV